MKKLNKLVLIILITIILLPNNVIAKEGKPELMWEQIHVKPDASYRGLEILCDANDGYITINSLGEIEKYNYDGKKVKTIVNYFNGYATTAVVDNTSLLIYEEGYNKPYLYKYSLNGELIFKRRFQEIEYVDIYDNGYFVISGNKIVKIDKEGNIISTHEVNYSIESYIINSDNNQIMIIEKNDKPYLISMDLNFNIIDEKEIKLQDIMDDLRWNKNKFVEVEDGYLLLTNNNFIKIDKEANVLFNNNINNYIEDGNYIDLGIVRGGYIIIASNVAVFTYSVPIKPVLIKFDKNGSLLYEEEYPSEYKGYNYYYFSKIITLNNDDYIVQVELGKSYNEYYGRAILKYGYKDYNITTNIKGDGTIDVNETAKEGEKVTFKVNPSNNYELKSSNSIR